MANTYLGKTGTLANADLDKLAGGLPGGGRTNTTLAQLLANNLGANPIDFATPGLIVNTGVNDARAAIAAADTAAQAGIGDIFISPGVYKITNAGGSTFTILSRVKFAKGAILKPLFGVKVVLQGGVEAGSYAIFDESQGGVHSLYGASIVAVNIAWWLEVTTNGWNTPVPKTPSASDGPTSLSGMGSCVATHNYKASTTRWSLDTNGVARETGPSPLSVSYTAVNEGMFGIIPEDPGCGLENGETGIALGFSAYIRDLADNIDHRSVYGNNGTSDGYTQAVVSGWADLPDYLGCTYCAYDNTRPAPPAGGTTGIDTSGGVVKVPPTAPKLVQLGGLIRNATYNFAISYTYGDGSEGPLSVSASATIGNHAGGHAIVFPGEAPPLGAHFINVYAKHSADATLRRVMQRPVGAVAIEIHDIPAAADNPVRDPSVAYFDAFTGATAVHPVYPGQGTALSTISPILLAARCVRDAGGAIGIMVPAGTNYYKSPLILDANPAFQNSLGETGFGAGLRIFAEGGLNGVTEVRFLGPITGVTGIVNTYPRLVIENVRFTEQPGNARLRYGLRFSDYSGGGSFFCQLINCAIDAEALHGIGIIADSASGGTPPSGSHTCSELMIMGGFAGGRRGALYFAGAQTGNIHINHLVQLQCGADSGAGPGGVTSAHSFVIKHACPNSVLTCETPWMDGGQYKVFLTDTWMREGGGAPVFYGRSLGGECHGNNGGSFGIYSSSVNVNGSAVRLTGECGFQNSTPHAFLDIYQGSRDRVASINNLWRNPVVLDHVFAELHQEGGSIAKVIRTKRFYGGGQAPAQAYPQAMDYSTSGKFDALAITPLIGGTVDVTLDGSLGTILTVDASTGNRAVVIPSALYRPGQLIIVKKIETSANTVTITSLGDQANNGKTFDGGVNYVIPGGSKGSVWLWSDGVEWKVLAKF